MTTPRLVDVIDGLEAQLRSIDGLRVFDHVPSSAEFPAAFILPPDIDYLVTMHRGIIGMELEVVVLVSAVVDRMQKDLFGYADWTGPQSIVTAIANDPTLGLSGIEAIVRSSRSLGLEEMAGYQAWGIAVRIEIHKHA